MNLHLQILVYVLGLIAGTVAITLAAAFYRRYRKKSLRYYALFLSSLAAILVSFLVDAYLRLTNLGDTAQAFVWLAGAVGGLFFIFVAPFFYHALLGIPLPGALRSAYLALGVFAVVVAVIEAIMPAATWTDLVLSVVLFGMVAYGLILLVVFLRRVGEPVLRRALVTFLVVSLVFFPLMVLDSVGAYIPVTAFLSSDLWQPLYFLVLSLLSTVFAVRYLNRPAYAAPDGRPTEYFVERYKLTAREVEIIPLVVEGQTSKDIGEALFISPKTVENHVYNIYQKLGVRNRLQLFSLLMSNRAD